jgi:hypothetical protein
MAEQDKTRPVERVNGDVYELPEQYRCLPIFEHFKPETLDALCQLTWVGSDTEGDGILYSPRAYVSVEIPEVGYKDANERVCPLAFCLWHEQRAWRTRPEDMEDYESGAWSIDAEGHWLLKAEEYVVNDDGSTGFREVERVYDVPMLVPAFDGEPGDGEIALQILAQRPGLSVYALPNSELRDRYDALRQQAEDFITAWDGGYIPPHALNQAVCRPEPKALAEGEQESVSAP